MGGKQFQPQQAVKSLAAILPDDWRCLQSGGHIAGHWEYPMNLGPKEPAPKGLRWPSPPGVLQIRKQMLQG